MITCVEFMVSSEKKLQLARQIRSRQHADRNILRSREQLLYGSDDAVFDAGFGEEYDASNNARNNSSLYSSFYSSLCFRVIFSFLLLFIVFWTAKHPGFFFGIGKDDISAAIEADYSANLFDFINEIPYTLKDNK